MDVRERLAAAYPEREFLLPEGFDEAVVGVVGDSDNPRVAYSVSKCVRILMERDGMGKEEALDFFEYNVRGTHFSNHPEPVWVEDDFLTN